MEEQLALIQSKLHKSETSFPILRDQLMRCGELRAWFKYYHGPNQWAQRYYMEEHLFLTKKNLLIACIYTSGKVTLRSFKLDEISRIERNYDFADKANDKLVLASVEIIFKRTRDKKHLDAIQIARPLPEEDGDPEGFERFMDLLD